MDEWAVMMLSAFWFGILTSISPCPLATNVAAISYISKGIQSPYRVFATGLAYTIGRMLSYLVLGTRYRTRGKFTLYGDGISAAPEIHEPVTRAYLNIGGNVFTGVTDNTLTR
ncbi:hypothetical protein TUM4637_28940 [Shewanella hafniensis]|nr:hypothetical protein TUM4637_28940 [Shewanella hafniensis]